MATPRDSLGCGARHPSHRRGFTHTPLITPEPGRPESVSGPLSRDRDCPNSTKRIRSWHSKRELSEPWYATRPPWRRVALHQTPAAWTRAKLVHPEKQLANIPADRAPMHTKGIRDLR